MKFNMATSRVTTNCCKTPISKSRFSLTRFQATPGLEKIRQLLNFAPSVTSEVNGTVPVPNFGVDGAHGLHVGLSPLPAQILYKEREMKIYTFFKLKFQ